MKKQLLTFAMLFFSATMFAQVNPQIIYSFDDESIFGSTPGQAVTIPNPFYLTSYFNANFGENTDTIFSSNVSHEGGLHSMQFDSIQFYTESTSRNFGQNATYNYWIKHAKQTGNVAICLANGQLTNNVYSGTFISGLNTDNKLFFDMVKVFNFGGADFETLTSKNPLDTNWHMITLAHEPTILSLYIDGVLDTSVTLPNATAGSATNQKLQLGAIRSVDSNGDRIFQPYQGLMDEVAYYNVTLTSAQILELYNVCGILENPPLTLVNDTFFVAGNNLTVEWIDCATETVILGQNNSFFAPTVSGSYTPIVESGGCTFYYDCIDYTATTVGIDETELKIVSLFPNPAINTITIEINEEDAVISIVDVLGKEVLYVNATGNKAIINTDKLTSGVYYANIIAKGHSIQKKFLINR